MQACSTGEAGRPPSPPRVQPQHTHEDGEEAGRCCHSSQQVGGQCPSPLTCFFQDGQGVNVGPQHHHRLPLADIGHDARASDGEPGRGGGEGRTRCTVCRRAPSLVSCPCCCCTLTHPTTRASLLHETPAFPSSI